MKIIFALLISFTAVDNGVAKVADVSIAAKSALTPANQMIQQCISCSINGVTKTDCVCPNGIIQMRKYPCGPAASCKGWCCQPNKCRLCTEIVAPGDPMPIGEETCTCDAPLVRQSVNMMCVASMYCCGTKQQPSRLSDSWQAENIN
jgi:hypothetical protein